MKNSISVLGGSFAFSNVERILKEEQSSQEFHPSIPYRIRDSVNYTRGLIDSFESSGRREYIPSSRRKVLSKISEHYVLDSFEDLENLNYICDNLENSFHCLNDLENNPGEFYSRKDSQLLELVSTLKDYFKDELNLSYLRSKRELEFDD